MATDVRIDRRGRIRSWYFAAKNRFIKNIEPKYEYLTFQNDFSGPNMNTYTKCTSQSSFFGLPISQVDYKKHSIRACFNFFFFVYILIFISCIKYLLIDKKILELCEVKLGRMYNDK